MNSILKASILAILLLTFEAQGSAQTVSAPTLSDDDKAAIIKNVIDLWFSRAEALPPAEGADLLKHNTLSTEDMSTTLVSKLSGIKLVLRKPKQIEKLKHRPTPIRFLRVNSISRVGDKIGLTLGAISVVNDTPLGVHSYHYLFERIDGQWQGKLMYIIC